MSLSKANDIGDDNLWRHNELFALPSLRPMASEKNSANGRAGNDAPLTLSYQVVFCKDRLEYRQRQGGLKSVVKYAKWYTPEKAKYRPPSRLDLSGNRMKCLLLPRTAARFAFTRRNSVFRTHAVVLRT